MKILKARLLKLETQDIQKNYSSVIHYRIGEEPPENTVYGRPVMLVPYCDNEEEWEEMAVRTQDELIKACQS